MSPPPSPAQPPRILVVDDDPAMARATQRVLRLAGYESLSAGDGLVARSLVYSFKPQLVVLDLCMPTLDGRALTTLLRELAEATPELACKLLVVSGAAREMLRHALALGADDVLPKPFDNEELLQRIGDLLADLSPAR